MMKMYNSFMGITQLIQHLNKLNNKNIMQQKKSRLWTKLCIINNTERKINP